MLAVDKNLRNAFKSIDFVSDSTRQIFSIIDRIEIDVKVGLFLLIEELFDLLALATGA